MKKSRLALFLAGGALLAVSLYYFSLSLCYVSYHSLKAYDCIIAQPYNTETFLIVLAFSTGAFVLALFPVIVAWIFVISYVISISLVISVVYVLTGVVSFMFLALHISTITPYFDEMFIVPVLIAFVSGWKWLGFWKMLWLLSIPPIVLGEGFHRIDYGEFFIHAANFLVNTPLSWVTNQVVLIAGEFAFALSSFAICIEIVRHLLFRHGSRDQKFGIGVGQRGNNSDN